MILKSCAFLFSFLFLSISLPSQSWQKIIVGDLNELPTSIWSLPNGGYAYTIVREIISGTKSIGRQSVMVRTDSKGNTIWSKAAESKNNHFSGVALQKSGHIILASNRSPSTGFDIKVHRLDDNGQTLWKKVLPYPGDQSTYVYAPTKNNGIAFVGYTTISRETFVINLDQNGNLLWKSDFSDLNTEKWNPLFGGMGETENGQFFLGWNQHKNHMPKKGHLTSFDSLGNRLWSKMLGEDFSVGSVTTTSDNGCIVGGRSGRMAFIAKYDASGNEVWFTTLRSQYEIISVAENKAGEIGALLRPFGEFIAFLRFDKNGSLIERKDFKDVGKCMGESIKATQDGGFIIAGSVRQLDIKDGDLYLIKIGGSDPVTDEDKSIIEEEKVEPMVEEPIKSIPLQSPTALHPDIFVTAFPNPFQNEITFRFESNQIIDQLTLNVFDLNGRLVHEGEYPEGDVRLNFGHLPAGSYVYLVTQHGQKIANGKLIKQD